MGQLTVRQVQNMFLSGSISTRIYSDATYTYICEAPIGTALDKSIWRVKRVNNTDGTTQYADSGNFSQLATDLATVQGLSYAY